MMEGKTVSPKKTSRTETQVLLAQYFTPEVIADFMSSMFNTFEGKIEVLDPGAGEGVLGLTLLKRFGKSYSKAAFVELDKPTFEVLSKNVEIVGDKEKIDLINDDFVNAAFEMEIRSQLFSHIILNPPYFKLRVDSASSKLLRLHGIQITNIYAAFVWLSARLLKDGGQLVAIIPRSFCNGPYFLSFRQYLVNNFSVEGIHIFSSRNKAFSKDSVLQENIILHIAKKEQSGNVKLTYSTDQSFSDTQQRFVPFSSIVESKDDTKTIHIPSINQSLSLGDHATQSLQDLGLMVSTGPIVDFRLKESILNSKAKNSIPLLYPAHMSGHETDWPSLAFNKIGQYYQAKKSTTSSLVLDGIEALIPDRNSLPLDGYYVIVRRFSSKEEKRRIFAAVVNPERFNEKFITFENHLNYFHAKKHGLSKDLAYGLCAYLNSSILDEHFRKVSGHTQVNVSDLKRMPYPTNAQLLELGKTMQSMDGLIDDIVTKEIVGTIL